MKTKLLALVLLAGGALFAGRASTSESAWVVTLVPTMLRRRWSRTLRHFRDRATGMEWGRIVTGMPVTWRRAPTSVATASHLPTATDIAASLADGPLVAPLPRGPMRGPVTVRQ